MDKKAQPLLILASSSPRRQELIRSLGLPYEVISSNADESVDEKLSPAEIVEVLALRKAKAVREFIQPAGKAGIVIGSDTIVVHEGQILGKPSNTMDSQRMLSLLQGNTHQVYSGIACIDSMTGHIQVSHRVTNVTMKRLSDEQINRYIATGEPSDKAGSYAIQGLGATIVEGIEGDYFNVVGLSLSLLSDLLETYGIQIV
jgi:septum formation protein